MSDDNEQNQRAHTQLQKELAELDSPRAKYQAILDRWYEQRQAAIEEENRWRRYLDGLGIYDPL